MKSNNNSYGTQNNNTTNLINNEPSENNSHNNITQSVQVQDQNMNAMINPNMNIESQACDDVFDFESIMQEMQMNEESLNKFK